MAISLDLIADARDTDIYEVARRVGANLKRVGASEWAGPCPACGGTDRFAVNPKRRLFNCRSHGGGDVIAMVRHALSFDFAEAIEFIVGRSNEASAQLRQHPSVDDLPPSNAQRRSLAVACWNEAVNPRRTLVEIHLASRKLKVDHPADDIRFHPLCGWREGEKMLRVPAMVCAMRAIDGDELVAIHRTRLTPDGQKVDRRMLGKADGAAVKLDPDGTVTYGLTIGEGIETCLAARQLDIRPTWALGSAGAIARFPVLAGVDALTLLAEDDETSRGAVEACAARWHAAGRQVIIVRPTMGKDVNDAIRGAG